MLRDGDDTTTFEDVVVCDRRPVEKQGKSVICRFADGKERFVPRSQVRPDFEFPDDGEPFDLEVSLWITEQWANEPLPAVVKVPDVVVMREIDGKYGPAILVRLPDGKEEWVSLSGVAADSPVRSDGDRGELWVLEWVAKKKGWGGAARQPAQPAANVGEDARSGELWGDPDGDDKLLF